MLHLCMFQYGVVGSEMHWDVVICEKNRLAHALACFVTGFAMMEAMLVLAAALQNIEFGVASEQAFPQATPRITLRPAAVELVLRPRTSSNAVRN